MADENGTATGAGAGGEQQAAPQQQFVIQRIYLKDTSFETPNSPQIFTEQWQPEVNLDLGNDAQKVADGVWEASISITVTTKVGEKVAFLAEVKQAGIFTITGFDDVTLDNMLGGYCPNILFPFAREAVADLVTRGGFPQLLLSPVNFEAIHAQRRQQNAQQQAGGDAA